MDGWGFLITCKNIAVSHTSPVKINLSLKPPTPLSNQHPPLTDRGKLEIFQPL